MKVNEANVIEVEIDDACNRSLSFFPLKRRIRGRLDFHRVPGAKEELQKWPRPIPGQRLVLDLAAGEAHLVESLHLKEFELEKRKIERADKRIPDNESFGKVDVPTWLFWLKRAVEDKTATLIRGQFPAVIEGEIKKSVLGVKSIDTNANLAKVIEKLGSALEAQTAVMTKLFEKLAAGK